MNPTPLSARSSLILNKQQEKRATHFPSVKPTAQKSPRHRITHGNRQLFAHWWLETCSVFATYAALAAIISILGTYNRRPLPDWPDYLSLNSIVSIFTTIVRASLALVLGEGLGQLKWTWFQRVRPLDDIRTYDDASRGPLGAVRLLLDRHTNHKVASFGALTTCALIFMGPFSQQVLKYYNCPQTVSEDSAILPVAQAYNEYGVQGPPVGIKLAVTAGLVNPDQYQPSFTCDTGNCTVPERYSSWGFCSKCDDYSETVVVSRAAPDQESDYSLTTITNTTLPSGLSLSWDSSTWYGAGNLFESRAIVDGQQVAVQIGLSSGGSVPVGRSFGQFAGCPRNPEPSDWRCRGYGGSQCWIRPCIRTYNGSVVSGQLKEVVVDEIINFNAQLVAIDVKCLTPEQLNAATSLGYTVTSPQGLLTAESNARNLDQSVPANCVYSMRGDTLSEINKYIRATLSGYIDNVGDIGNESSEAVGTLYSSGRVSYEQVSNYFSNITAAITKHIRQNGDPASTVRVAGFVSRSETCVQVRWIWLSYPILMVVMTTMFFFSMVWQSGSHFNRESLGHTNEDASAHQISVRHNLKSDILSVLFHGFDEKTLQKVQRRQYGYSSDTAELIKDAKLQNVQMRITEHGWKLVLDENDGNDDERRYVLDPLPFQLQSGDSSADQSLLSRQSTEPSDRS